MTYIPVVYICFKALNASHRRIQSYINAVIAMFIFLKHNAKIFRIFLTLIVKQSVKFPLGLIRNMCLTHNVLNIFDSFPIITTNQFIQYSYCERILIL